MSEKPKNYNDECASKGCEHYVEWPLENPNDDEPPYICISCELKGKSYNIEAIAENCPHKAKPTPSAPDDVHDDGGTLLALALSRKVVENLKVEIKTKNAKLAALTAKAERLREAGQRVLDEEPSDGAANRYPYIEHAMLCMSERGGECDCGLQKYYDAMDALRAALVDEEVKP